MDGHLHITLSGIDVIKKGLDCHPFDGNPALEVVETGVSMALSSVTKVVSHAPLVPALEGTWGSLSRGQTNCAPS